MVGINTPSPEAALHVVGDTRIEGTLIPDEIDYTFDKPYFGVCETAAATQAKVVTCDEFRLEKDPAGGSVHLRQHRVLPVHECKRNRGDCHLRR